MKMVCRSVKDQYTDNGIFFFFLVIDKIFFGYPYLLFFLVCRFSLVATCSLSGRGLIYTFLNIEDNVCGNLS